MSRKIILESSPADRTLLTETLAENEEQLQEFIKENPDLLPIEDFGMSGPLMVIGRETGLRSGAVDLVALARGGELLLIEFKTGPQNSDFRSALSQLLDYGAAVWHLSFEEFEQAVAVRYFASDRCSDTRLKGKQSLEEAARLFWTDLTEEELSALRDHLSSQLASGTMQHVLVAQRFTDTMESTMEYLNSITPSVNFWAVELVRFTGDSMSAFESRTLLRLQTRTGAQASRISEAVLLQKLQDENYKDAIQDLLDTSRGLGYEINMGAAGLSIRLRSPEGQSVSVGWFFPPGVSGWMGLTDLTLGFGDWALEASPSVTAAVRHFEHEAASLPDVERVAAKGLNIVRVPPDAVPKLKDRIRELLGEFAESIAKLGA